MKTKQNRKWKISHTLQERRTSCFNLNITIDNATVMSLSSRKFKSVHLILRFILLRKFILNLTILNLYQGMHIESSHIKQMCVILKQSVFIFLTIIHKQSKKKKTTSRHSLKKSVQNLKRFYGAFFDLEILEIFTAAFLLIISWSWNYIMALSNLVKWSPEKRRKNLHKKYVRRKKTVKKEGEKWITRNIGKVKQQILLLFYLEKIIFYPRT